MATSQAPAPYNISAINRIFQQTGDALELKDQTIQLSKQLYSEYILYLRRDESSLHPLKGANHQNVGRIICACVYHANRLQADRCTLHEIQVSLKFKTTNLRPFLQAVKKVAEQAGFESNSVFTPQQPEQARPALVQESDPPTSLYPDEFIHPSLFVHKACEELEWPEQSIRMVQELVELAVKMSFAQGCLPKNLACACIWYIAKKQHTNVRHGTIKATLGIANWGATHMSRKLTPVFQAYEERQALVTEGNDITGDANAKQDPKEAEEANTESRMDEEID